MSDGEPTQVTARADRACDDGRALTGEPRWGPPESSPGGSAALDGPAGPTPCQGGEVPNPAGVELPLFGEAGRNPAFEGEAGQVCPPARAGLVADAVQVGVDGTDAELQQLRDVLIGLAAGDQLEDLPLPLGDPDGRLEQVGGERRRDIGALLRDGANRPDDLGLLGQLGEVASGTGPDRLDDVGGCLRGGHHQNGLAAGAQMGDGRRPAEPGQVQVQQHDLGLCLALGVQLLDRAARTDQPEVRCGVDHVDESLAEDRMVLDDCHPDHLGPHSFTRVPRPGADHSSAWPPTSCMRLVIDCSTPKPWCSALGSNPRPWSRTMTSTRPVPACFATLVSASRVAPIRAAATAGGGSRSSPPVTSSVCRPRRRNSSVSVCSPPVSPPWRAVSSRRTARSSVACCSAVARISRRRSAGMPSSAPARRAIASKVCRTVSWVSRSRRARSPSRPARSPSPTDARAPWRASATITRANPNASASQAMRATKVIQPSKSKTAWLSLAISRCRATPPARIAAPVLAPRRAVQKLITPRP